jgi:hypothetical protein
MKFYIILFLLFVVAIVCASKTSKEVTKIVEVKIDKLTEELMPWETQK